MSVEIVSKCVYCRKHAPTLCVECAFIDHDREHFKKISDQDSHARDLPTESETVQAELQAQEGGPIEIDGRGGALCWMCSADISEVCGECASKFKKRKARGANN